MVLISHHTTSTVALLLTIAYPALGYIKCYCNLPECAEDGNICTSYMDFCFTKIHMDSSQESRQNLSQPTRDIHGCLENLPEGDVLDAQTRDGTGVAVRQPPGGAPLLYCCTGDMCNYEENPKGDQLYTVNHVSEYDSSTDFPFEETSHISRRLSESQQDTVLKIAVIVVPAAGSLILVILIIFAVKLLQDDRRNIYSEQGGFKKSLGFVPYFNFNNKLSSESSTNYERSRTEMGATACCEPLNTEVNHSTPHPSIAGVHNTLLIV